VDGGIYNASPLFAFRFPTSLTLGGWLGGALQWHFAAMWLLAVNGLVYLALNAATGRVRRRFWPLSPRQLVSDFGAALRGHLSHDDLARYNAVQKAAYIGAVVLLVIMVLSDWCCGSRSSFHGCAGRWGATRERGSCTSWQ